MSISEKLNKIEIPEEEKELIIEDGLRFRILESENELRKINSEIRALEDMFGKKFESLKEDGLPDDADYKAHESFIVLLFAFFCKRIAVLSTVFINWITYRLTWGPQSAQRNMSKLCDLGGLCVRLNT